MIVRNSDNMVVYSSEWESTPEGVRKGKLIDRRYVPAEITVVPGDLPPEYLLKHTTYSGGVFARINDAPSKNVLRDIKIQQLKDEALKRFKAVTSAVESWDSVEMIQLLYLSVAPASRQPTAEMTSLINIYTAGKNAMITLKGYTTIAEIEAFNAQTTPSWP